MTPIFLLMDHFLYLFSTFSEEMKKIYWLEVRIFWKMHHWILFFLALHLSLRQFQMPLEGLSFVKTLAKLGIINASDSIIPNITRIISVDSCLIFLWTLETMLIYAHQIIKIRIFLHTHYLWTRVCHPHFFCFFFISESSHSLSVCSRSLKKIYQVEHFAPNILNIAMKTHLTILWLRFKMFEYLPIFALLLRQSTQVLSGATSWQEQPCQKCKKVDLKTII